VDHSNCHPSVGHNCIQMSCTSPLCLSKPAAEITVISTLPSPCLYEGRPGDQLIRFAMANESSKANHFLPDTENKISYRDPRAEAIVCALRTWPEHVEQVCFDFGEGMAAKSPSLCVYVLAAFRWSHNLKGSKVSCATHSTSNEQLQLLSSPSRHSIAAGIKIHKATCVLLYPTTETRGDSEWGTARFPILSPIASKWLHELPQDSSFRGSTRQQTSP
jgi:hypothetical protein